MASDQTLTDTQVIKHLKTLLEQHGPNADPSKRLFSDEEVAALKRVAARELALQAIGKLGSSLKTILTYIGFFIAVYVSAKTGVIEWIRSLVGQ